MKPEEFFLRDIIGNYLSEIKKKDNRVVLVNADLMGTCRNRSFAEEYPEHAFNVGIAEQNLVGFSAGLAHENFLPYAFSMAPFITMRACEQVRTDVAYANLNVRLIGAYSGLSGGISGATHWAMEDCAIIGSMPNMTVIEPCDPIQAKQIMDYSLMHTGPIYIRCSVEPVTSIYSNEYSFELGKASFPMEGTDGAYICSGITVKYAIEAAIMLKKTKGKNIRVVDMHTIKPIDVEAILEAAKTGKVVVAQDHNIIGGLGDRVASVIAQNGINTKLKICGITDKFMTMAHAPFLYNQFGYDTQGLYDSMVDLLNMNDKQ